MSDDQRSFDPAAIVGGLHQLLTWAAQTVGGPHSEHVDPGEHPDCLVCRGMGTMRALGLDAIVNQAGNGGVTDWDLDTSVNVKEPVTFVGNDEDVTWVRVKREHP
ncbi:MAG: hypothetical protein EXQ60_05840 [Candidatus Nanopelagicales bacterium]|nr:hypothetical protein [Candidatus Nanopelagicales bacterium]